MTSHVVSGQPLGELVRGHLRHRLVCRCGRAAKNTGDAIEADQRQRARQLVELDRRIGDQVEVAVVRHQPSRPGHERSVERNVERARHVALGELRGGPRIDHEAVASRLSERLADVERRSVRSADGSAGPSLFIRFIIAKYGGGSGWPASTLVDEVGFGFRVEGPVEAAARSRACCAERR